ncbi:methylthioribulose 1-phosphate dehydratase [Pseudoroseomonas cervicalis]|uniref:Methylthioribulose-1-phosphate dehydratase n=1 Tax=Pseudoroseomonas cervicalis ATCC 49957 TaxID=525371 RepID=D5RSA3_9PROT|nr:methylthioribulose 1-phosphate dehydratase [Pseudoroseomonas cervicalis]EFH09823.1 methylthioribulose-1-phosphate dehydratase [Pseudoroseomonas cervicalis ATCC 49957]
MRATIPDAAIQAIIGAGRRMDRFHWVPATAGNFSVRLPGGRVAITRSGQHKGFLGPDSVMVVDLEGRPEDPALRPSAETLLHCGIYRRFPEAGAVLHGHSIANTVLSRAAGDSIALAGYELLKAFPGLPTHEASVAVPVFGNDQDIPRLQAVVDSRWDGLASIPPGYLIRGHGVYVWAPDMDAALARLEALEFMLECEMRERRS